MQFISAWFHGYSSFQATEDAKKVVEEEKAYAQAEIESARESMQRIEQALHEQEELSGSVEKQVLIPLTLQMNTHEQISFPDFEPSPIVKLKYYLC